ncbi:MAG: MFS transporter [Chloroflexota bacterium]
MRFEKWQRNLTALWIAQTLNMVAFSFVIPFFPLYVQTLGVQGAAEVAQWAGILAAAPSLSLAISQPIWGSLADRFGRRPMVIRSMFGGGVVVGLMGFVSSPEQLLVLRLIQGLVTGTVAACNALVASTTPKAHLGVALGIMQVAIFLGMSIGPLIGGIFADTYGFRITFYVACILMLLGALIAAVFVEEQFTPPSRGVQRPSIWRDSRTLLSTAIFPILLGVTFLIQFGQSIVAPMLSLFIEELSGGVNAATMAGVTLAGTGVTSAISALALGRLGDRIGHTKILTVCLAGATITFFPQAMVQDVFQLVILRSLLGFFLGGLMPTANALIAQASPDARRGSAFGLSSASTSLAHGAGPLMGAGVATHWGLRAVFLATSILFAIAYIWTSHGFRKYPLSRAKPEILRPSTRARPASQSKNDS